MATVHFTQLSQVEEKKMTKVKILSLSKHKNLYTRMLIIPRSEKMKDLWKKHLTFNFKLYSQGFVLTTLKLNNYIHGLNMSSQPCFISELPIIILNKYFK